MPVRTASAAPNKRRSTRRRHNQASGRRHSLGVRRSHSPRPALQDPRRAQQALIAPNMPNGHSTRIITTSPVLVDSASRTGTVQRATARSSSQKLQRRETQARVCLVNGVSGIWLGGSSEVAGQERLRAARSRGPWAQDPPARRRAAAHKSRPGCARTPPAGPGRPAAARPAPHCRAVRWCQPGRTFSSMAPVIMPPAGPRRPAAIDGFRPLLRLAGSVSRHLATCSADC